MVLGEGQPCLEGGVVDISKRGLGLRLPAPLPVGTPIKVEFDDELILGEVCHCSPYKGAYRVGLAVKHRLSGLAALHRLNRSLHAYGQDPAHHHELDQTISISPRPSPLDRSPR